MLLWRRFLDNKVLLTFGKAFQCKEPGWFRLVFSDQAHRLRLGERSALPVPPNCILPLPALWPHAWPQHLTQPAVSADGPSLPFPRDAEDPAGAQGHVPGGRRPPFLSDPGAEGPAHVSWSLPCGRYCQPGAFGMRRLIMAEPFARKTALPPKDCSLSLGGSRRLLKLCLSSSIPFPLYCIKLGETRSLCCE